MIGRLSSVVLDCPDPHALAQFYSELLGLPVTTTEDDWVVIGERGGPGGRFAFQLAPDHQPPRWPDPAFPQQFHIDLMVDDIEEAEPKALALGATRLPSDNEEDGFRVYADPAGHPFCLCWK
jgi:catechol 2,3-dioxygenase-like lactoylglutathione lyase family enzyme